MSDDYGDYGESFAQELERLRRENKELASRLEEREKEIRGWSDAHVSLSTRVREAESRLDSERLDRTREYNVVAEKLFAKENELLAASHRLDEAYRQLDAMKGAIDQAAKVDGIATMRGWLINLLENLMFWERSRGAVVEAPDPPGVPAHLKMLQAGGVERLEKNS